MNELQVTLADVCEVLVASKCKFHLTGGLVSSYYGEPRFTQDIDVVIALSSASDVDGLVAGLSTKFIVDEVVANEAIRRQSIFQILHQETMIKIDFHVGEAIRGELNRSQQVEIFKNLHVPIVSKEDSILSKLIWIKKGSSKSRQDVIAILRLSKDLDANYLAEQVERYGVTDLFDEIKNSVE